MQPLTVRASALNGLDGLKPLEIKRTVASREEMLLPLTDRERMLVVAIAEGLKALQPRAEMAEKNTFGVGNVAALNLSEKNGLAGLMSAFRAATGVPFTEASW